MMPPINETRTELQYYRQYLSQIKIDLQDAFNETISSIDDIDNFFETLEDEPAELIEGVKLSNMNSILPHRADVAKRELEDLAEGMENMSDYLRRKVEICRTKNSDNQ